MLSLIIDKKYRSMEAKFRYLADIFNNVYDVTTEVKINYGESIPGKVNIEPSKAHIFFQSNQEQPEEIAWFTWKMVKLPCLFTTEINNEILTEDLISKSVTIHPDILGSAFYFLSCWQEYHSNSKDKLNRFPLESSIIHKLDILGIPVVNYYFDILAESIEMISGSRPVIRSSNEAPLSVSISHDIDHCMTGWREDSLQQFIAGEWKESLKKIWKGIKGSDIWFNFDQLLEIEKDFGITASYYFITTKKRYKGLSNADYDIDSPLIKKILYKILASGAEVGIHGSIGTSVDASKLSKEIARFPEPVLGGRFHYLILDLPLSFDVIEQVGLLYDSSLGFVEQIGFRNGFCYPFRPYNLREERAYRFWEFPIMVMDRTLIKSYYMGLSQDEAVEAVMDLICEVRQFHGYFNILWHNSVMAGFKYQGWSEVYQRIIRNCLDQGARIKSMGWYAKKISML